VYDRQYRENNREQVRAKRYEQWVKNKERELEGHRKRRLRNHEMYLDKERERAKANPRTEYMRQYRENNRERVCEINSDYQKRNKEKKRAHTAVFNAVKLGHIIKPSTCQKCSAEEPVEAHHVDYSQPLAVMWLCMRCHKEHHKKLKLNKVKDKYYELYSSWAL